MMVERRNSNKCDQRNPVCMTLGFMLGMVVGTIICANNSLRDIVVSVLLATVVFHVTFGKNFNIATLLSKVIRKGS
jgi:hypothetical protein